MHAFSADGGAVFLLDSFGLSRIALEGRGAKTNDSLSGSSLVAAGARLTLGKLGHAQGIVVESKTLARAKGVKETYGDVVAHPDGKRVLVLRAGRVRSRDVARGLHAAARLRAEDAAHAGEEARRDRVELHALAEGRRGLDQHRHGGRRSSGSGSVGDRELEALRDHAPEGRAVAEGGAARRDGAREYGRLVGRDGALREFRDRFCADCASALREVKVPARWRLYVGHPDAPQRNYIDA
jgi:hypothetical protein